MKLRYNFLINEMGDYYIAIPTSEGVVEFNGIIKLQEKEAFIIEKLNADITEEELVKAVCEKFGCDEQEMKVRVGEILAQLKAEDLLV
ncbi:MAG: PqqD family protein [Clostridia bacterium]|nr:PqqD family protein [Clostridia bacterium]